MNGLFQAFRDLLSSRAGIDPAAIGKGAIEASVRRRMRAVGDADEGAYLLRLQGSEDEFEELVLGVTVPETWFFREPESFRFLKEHASASWRRDHPGEALRALSIPCCTGEEPYSIAMTLFDAGLSPAEFSIDALDIHPAFLETARRAVYGKNSFRGVEEETIRRHFQPEGDRFSVRENVARQVRFEHGDALKMDSLPLGKGYHVIFCRNLLIYLHSEARARLLASLDRRLAEGGLLFAGHSETIPLDRYRPVAHPFSFAYARAPRAGRAPAGGPQAPPLPGPGPSATPSRRRGSRARTALRPAQRTLARLRRAGDVQARAREQRGCWQAIGIDGDKSCARLADLVHCRNCDVFSEAARRFFDRPVPEGYRAECLRELATAMEAEPGQTLQVVVFRIGPHWLALPTSMLKRIDQVPKIHRIPHHGERLLGLAKADGEMRLCVDLAGVLGLGTAGGASPDSRLLIIERNGEAWAFIADEAAQMPSWDPGHGVQAPPGPAAEYARGAWAHGDRSVLLLDEELLFSALQRCLK